MQRIAKKYFCDIAQRFSYRSHSTGYGKIHGLVVGSKTQILNTYITQYSRMPQEGYNETNVLLHLDPEIYEVLEHFGIEHRVSVHHSAGNLLMQAYELWRKGKLDIEITDKARKNYGKSRTGKKDSDIIPQKRHKNRD